MTKLTYAPIDDEADLVAQEAIRSGGNRAIAVLEKAFIRNGSGRYFVLRARREAGEDDLRSVSILAEEKR